MSATSPSKYPSSARTTSTVVPSSSSGAARKKPVKEMGVLMMGSGDEADRVARVVAESGLDYAVFQLEDLVRRYQFR